MTFIKYQHVEKFGTPEVADIVSLTEPCWVFPKIDGTNGSIWCENGALCFGSRNRQLSLEKDNQGFMATLSTQKRFADFFAEFPDVRLYGEWLVPHTLKTYGDDAWREFYVFDVCTGDNSEELAYLHYNEYKAMLDKYGIEYLPPLAVVERGDPERFAACMEQNTYLMKEGELGEGIVIKRYGFINQYGRTTWAKMVRSEFKTKHTKTKGPQVFAATAMVEESIVADFLTEAMVEKEFAKIVGENGGVWESKMIPRLLHTCYYTLVREECWNFVKAKKNPKIDFGLLQKLAFARVKLVKPELF